MRRISVIGIGAGNPDHLTLQAVAAIGEADVFFVIDKDTAPELVELRAEMLRRHARGGVPRVVTIPEVERDRDPSDYRETVLRWHHERAERIGAAISAELAPDAVGAFLVWGDPALYDSTLRVLERVRAGGTVEFACEVIPGITSAAALAAAHRITLAGVGEPVLITTGRRLTDDFGPETVSALVMLDGRQAFAAIDPNGVEILWGAYLGMADELLIAGDLSEVAERILTERAAARKRHGWIMDIYLLRRRPLGSRDDSTDSAGSPPT